MYLRQFLGNRGVQYALLASLVTAMVYYWGFVFDFGYNFQWDVLYTRNATYGEIFGLSLIEGFKTTIVISLISSAIAIFLGTIFGLARLSSFKPLYWFATAYVEFFRNTPLLVQLFFWYFALPMGLPESWRQAVFSVNFEFWSATLGLSVYTSSFMAEVVRAGVQSIPKGLLEAAYSSGLNYFQALRSIILPLAFRAIIPPLGSEFLNNMKNSSLAMVVGVAELCWQAQQIESLTFRGFEATTAASVLYLGLSLFISWIMNMINAKLRVDEEHHVHGMTRWLADRFFYPFGLAWRCLAGLCRVATSTSRAAGLRYTRSALVWKRVTTMVWHMVSFSAKCLFLAGLLLLLYQAGKGLLAFNWQIIGENLRTLLIWRFPSDEPGTVLWGLGGLTYSVLMAVIAISVSFFIGLFVGLGRMSKNVFFRLPSQLYIEIIRGNPLILIIFWVYFFVPIFINAYLDVFWSATIALTLFTGAYIAEIVRGGIQNIPQGQFEAAYGTGLGYGSTMIYIVLPQALKQMIPAIVGQFIAIFKDTSLAFVIGVLELTFVAQGLNNRLMVYPFEIYTTVAALYFICCYSMSIVASRLEARLSPEKARLVM